MSHVTCHMSHVTCHMSCLIFFCFVFLRLLFLRILETLPVFMFFIIIQLIPPVLLTPTYYCFHDQVIPPLHEVKKN